MASEIQSFAALIPAGTPINAPVAIDLSFPPRIVTEIDIIVPPGPAGNVGFAIGSAGQHVIPANSGAWIITDDEKINWPLEDYINSGSWTLFGYNLGAYNHTIYVRFLLALLNSATNTSQGSSLDVTNISAPATTPVPVIGGPSTDIGSTTAGAGIILPDGSIPAAPVIPVSG